MRSLDEITISADELIDLRHQLAAAEARAQEAEGQAEGLGKIARAQRLMREEATARAEEAEADRMEYRRRFLEAGQQVRKEMNWKQAAIVRAEAAEAALEPLRRVARVARWAYDNADYPLREVVGMRDALAALDAARGQKSQREPDDGCGMGGAVR